MIQSPDAHVVAAAADALVGLAEAKTDQKREVVQRMVDLYESTWNLMDSVRPEDRVEAKIAHGKWEIFGKSLRQALQALSRQQLTQPTRLAPLVERPQEARQMVAPGDGV